jgi:hypothetical protein
MPTYHHHIGQLLGGNSLLLGPLEAELREQVLTHQPVLQLTARHDRLPDTTSVR